MKTILFVILGLSVVACGRSFKGDTGSAGATGLTGAQGIQGVPGLNGAGCSVVAVPVGVVAPNGGSLVTCGDGTQSLVLNGTPGVAGSNGSNGVAGTPGTVITPIQFCSGLVPSYPSTFAESGICLNNQMYGVYSANDGFFALLPPGTYSSNGINASCTFTIGLNCAVN